MTQKSAALIYFAAEAEFIQYLSLSDQFLVDINVEHWRSDK